MRLLHLLAGPNGAGKTTLYERSIQHETGLPFVNADEIARAIAGGGPITREISVEAAMLAARRRDEFIANGASFVADVEIDKHKITDGQYLAATGRVDVDAAFRRIVERLM